jgi:long-subunit fatty acid transport protein
MGGAVVSIADSVDACYYNPAGLTQVKASTVSLSANLYGFQLYHVENGLFPGENVQGDSFVTIPSTMGGIWKYGPELSLAFSALVPDRSSYNEIVAYHDSQHLYQVNEDDQTLWVGPSAAYQLTPSLSLGASLFGVYRSYNESISLFYEDYDASYARGRKFNDVALAAVLGLQYRPGCDWSIGLTLQPPTGHLYDSGKTMEHVLGRNVLSNNFYYTENVNTDNQLPTKIALGVGRQVQGDYAFGLDLTYHLPTSYNLQQWQALGQENYARIVRAPVLDLNLGGEYYIQKIYPVRAGFYTGFSSVPEINEKDNYASSNVDIYGLTVSIGREVRNVAFNVGLNYIFGRGYDLGYELNSKNEPVQVVVHAWEQQILFTVNTAYYF